MKYIFRDRFKNLVNEEEFNEANVSINNNDDKSNGDTIDTTFIDQDDLNEELHRE